jgi:hypothetical protein
MSAKSNTQGATVGISGEKPRARGGKNKPLQRPPAHEEEGDKRGKKWLKALNIISGAIDPFFIRNDHAGQMPMATPAISGGRTLDLRN